MCGIAGLFSRGREVTANDVGRVRAMIAAESHRGPDGEGLIHEGPVALGHRRLAIIDLSDNGIQPMGADGLWITFNGEIYNYRDLQRRVAAAGYPCRTQTDTEVILRGYEAWGMEGILRRLEGMFAFALADLRDKPTLYLARDRFGVKPLYIADDGNRIAFASEVRAFVKSDLVAPALDEAAVIGYLAFASVPAPRTFIRGVSSLPPATFVRVTRDETAKTTFWELPPTGFGPSPSDEELASELRSTAAEHLLADVPVGVFLSGGVDAASIVAATASRAEGNLRTLTVVFDGEESDEGEAARAVARRHGTVHHEVMVSGPEFAKCLPEFLESIDQPSNDGVNTWFIARAAKSVGLKAVLSGLGGDEIFLGYPHYHRLASRPATLARAVPDPAWKAFAAAAALAGSRRHDERVQRFDYSAHHSGAAGWYLLARGFFPPVRVAELVGCSEAEVHGVVAQAVAMCVPTRDPLAGVHYLELRRYLHDQLLRDADVFSMAHSIEARVPLLDRRLVEAVNRVPLRKRISATENKPLLVQATGDPNVRAAARRPKRGFTLPIGRWMQENPHLVGDLLANASLLDPPQVRIAWHEFRTGRVHWSRIWALVALQAAVAAA